MRQQRETERFISNANALLTNLKSCKDLEWGRKIHAKAVESRNDSNKYVATALVKMYTKCGSMVEARSVFDTIQQPDVVSWTTLLLGYAESAKGWVALGLFSRMKACECEPDAVTYVAVLKVCSSLAGNEDGDGKASCLKLGKQIHSEIGSHLNHYVQNTLIDMYANCASMVDACRVFDSIQKPDVVCWSALLLGYAENGEGQTALDMFLKMKACGCTPDSITYIAALKACTSLAVNGNGKACLEWGRHIHSEIGCHLDHYLENMLIDMYAKGGCMSEARHMFDRIQKPDVVSWNVLILGYADNGEGLVALDLFSKMKSSGCAPVSATYVAALKACTSLAVNGNASECLQQGRQIHSEIGVQLDHYLNSSLIDMYSKCGGMLEARGVFDCIQNPNVVSWTALILGYAETGEGLVALELFLRMKTHGCAPNSVTYVAILKACTSLAVNGDGNGLEYGREIHLEIRDKLDQNVLNTLIDMYSKSGSMIEARSVFDSMQKPDVVSWNTLILGYAENKEGHIALDLFSRMKVRGIEPVSGTYVAALKACMPLHAGDGNGCLEKGKLLHLELGSHMDSHVQSTLIDMYAKCGSMTDSRRVFDSIQKPDVVAWTALLLGYVSNGEGHVALDLFSKMKMGGCLPDSITYMAALRACGLVGDLALGRKFHVDIREFTVHIVTCLVSLYAKCGSMVEAREVFDLHCRVRDVSTWNALLAGYASFGETNSVFCLFETMRFRPDAVTFVCMLLSCSHAGLVEKAWGYFEAMPVQYGVTRDVLHYNCMVDILGRVNQMNEATAVLRKMPYTPNAVTWRALLGACRKWRNVEMGRLAFQSLVGRDKKDAYSAYVLMAHIYGCRGMWDEQEKLLETFGQAYLQTHAGT